MAVSKELWDAKVKECDDWKEKCLHEAQNGEAIDSAVATELFDLFNEEVATSDIPDKVRELMKKNDEADCNWRCRIGEFLSGYGIEDIGDLDELTEARDERDGLKMEIEHKDKEIAELKETCMEMCKQLEDATKHEIEDPTKFYRGIKVVEELTKGKETQDAT
jgi:hypothetical protein